MKDLINKATVLIYKAVASRKFFILVLGIFIFQAVWLAFTAIYPMPFDEYAHVGAIQIYANQWSPFITEQTADTGIYGELTRTPSYLYHYLMSFPYRLLNLLSNDQFFLVASLRLINVAMVVGALFLFQKLFTMWKIPRRVMHIAFLVFACTPIVPFVAAHVNYDNFILLITPVVLIFGTRLILDKGDISWNTVLFAIFGAVGLLAKETFAPLILVITLYAGWRLWREHKHVFWRDVRDSVQANILKLSFLAACFVLIVCIGLVAERYGGNKISYGSFRVTCDKIQPRELCEDFGPWYRDNVINVQNRPAEKPYGNPLSFSQYWTTRMMRGFYVAFSHTPTKVVWDKEPYGPIVARPLLPIHVWTGTIMLAGGIVALLIQWRRVFASKPYRFIAVVSGFYLAAVWAFNYQSYLRLWKAEAIQARYTYPILLLLFVLLLQCISWSVQNRNAKSILVLLLIPFYVWGGGIATWLIRADDTWRWQNPAVQSINRTTQSILKHIVIH